MADERDETEAPPTAGARKPNPTRQLIEFGPLLLFFVTNLLWGIFVATGVFMVAIIVAMALSWKLERRIPPMTIFTAVLVVIFGGLTIYLQDELFIKLKLTIISLLFAGILLFGFFSGRSPVKAAMGHAMQLEDANWRSLDLRFALYFIFLAALNEVIRRIVSTDTWVAFKVFGTLGITFLFLMTQMPYIMRNQIPEEESS